MSEREVEGDGREGERERAREGEGGRKEEILLCTPAFTCVVEAMLSTMSCSLVKCSHSVCCQVYCCS